MEMHWPACCQGLQSRWGLDRYGICSQSLTCWLALLWCSTA